jgi:signal transduction histidine kinase
MNLWSPRRRLVLVCSIALIVGYATHLVADRFVFSLPVLDFIYGFCNPTGTCRSLDQQAWWLLPNGFGLLVFAVLLAVLPWVGRWVLRPLRDAVPVITQLGPQNLNHRIRATGGRTDEFATLCRAVDAMMDRIAAGYEGQRRFAANASHELRTPLAVQRMLVEVGLAQPLTADQFTLLTKQLLQANERNERIVEGLLVLSEIDQGLASRLPERLDRIAAGVVAAHQAQAGAGDIRLVEELPPRVVYGEQVLLDRLVTNLVQNAIKYNHPQGTVWVTVGDSPALTVVNTGHNVPDNAVSDLFEPFKRLAGDRIDHSGGAGLGLAIARSIALAHDGTITATARDGGGLRVEVQLPEQPDAAGRTT